MPSTITEVDIEDWTELIRIAKQTEPATQKGRGSISFEPSIVCPYLSATLGPEMFGRLKNYDSTNELTEQDRSAVLAVLNEQRLTSNALVENPQITYQEWKWRWQRETGLHIAKTYISDSFWEGTLIKQLLSEGILTLAPDGRHLKIKADLTDKQRRQVEWLHVGIMNFAYGNLLWKRQYPFQKELGDNWYFNRW